MSESKETWWDRFLIEHQKFFLFLVRYWYDPKRKLKWYLNLPAVIKDWRYRHQFKPGSFYLDHGYTPMILIEQEKDGTLRGVSLIDGKEINSDLYHCAPESVDEKTAWAQVKTVREEKEKFDADNTGTEATD